MIDTELRQRLSEAPDERSLLRTALDWAPRMLYAAATQPAAGKPGAVGGFRQRLPTQAQYLAAVCSGQMTCAYATLSHFPPINGGIVPDSLSYATVVARSPLP